MGLDDITDSAEEDHDKDRLQEHLESMDEHVEELERLENMVVNMSHRLEQLEDRIDVLESAVGSEDGSSDDSFLDEEDNGSDVSW
jgi:uncharacterized protein Yka (UPF0111/DUF47 family)